MGTFELLSALVTLTALFSYVNRRFIRLPPTIGVMLISLAASLLILALGSAGSGIRNHVQIVLNQIDFEHALLHGMLAFLLFAGALNLNVNDLTRQWLPVSLLALVGTVITTFLVGGMMWLILRWLAMPVPFLHSLLLGAVVSPTDPIAVIGIMKRVGAPRELVVTMAGESLFNDGVGVVIFLVLLDLVSGGVTPTANHVALLLARSIVGGILLGMAAGILVYQLIKHVEDYVVEVLLTLALAMGVYAAGEAVGVSAPIAVIVAGLFIGNTGRAFAMSKHALQHLDTFWEMIDEILNAILFLLVGMEVLLIPFSAGNILAGLIGIPVILLARWLSVGGLLAPMRMLKWQRTPAAGTVTILTWGGLRGGLSVAMALSLPTASHRSLFLVITYCIVVFSVCVQGMSIGPVLRLVLRRASSRAESPVRMNPV